MSHYWKEQNFENDFAHSLYNRMVQNNNRLPKSSGLVLFGATSMLVILLSGLVVMLPPFSANATHRLNIPNNLFTPPNQGQSVPKGQSIPQGLTIPKNLIVAPVLTVLEYQYRIVGRTRLLCRNKFVYARQKIGVSKTISFGYFMLTDIPCTTTATTIAADTLILAGSNRWIRGWSPSQIWFSRSHHLI
jgi:hypothetical protein